MLLLEWNSYLYFVLYRRGWLITSASAYTALLELSMNNNNNKSVGDGVAERTKVLVAMRTGHRFESRSRAELLSGRHLSGE